jgi:type IV secretion system protein VirB6
MSSTTTPIFTSISDILQTNIVNVVSHNTSTLINLISPLIALCFSIYVMLIMFSYIRGNNDEAIMDFFTRMIAWVVIITFGMNISYYNQYVVPFFSGLGDELANAMNNGSSSISAIDSIANTYISNLMDLWNNSHGSNLLYAVAAIIILTLTTLSSLCIAGTYIILAKVVLSVLLSIGCIFISLALFPATRSYFGLWVSACVNCILISLLFAIFSKIQVDYMKTVIPKDLTLTALLQSAIGGIVFILIDFYIPSLASSLSGGVTITSNMKNGKRMAGSIASGVAGSVVGGIATLSFLRGLLPGSKNSISNASESKGSTTEESKGKA